MTLSDWRGLRVSGAVSHAGTQSAVVTEPTEPDSTAPSDQGGRTGKGGEEGGHQLPIIGRQSEMGSADTQETAAAAAAAEHWRQPLPLVPAGDSSLLMAPHGVDAAGFPSFCRRRFPPSEAVSVRNAVVVCVRARVAQATHVRPPPPPPVRAQGSTCHSDDDERVEPADPGQCSVASKKSATGGVESSHHADDSQSLAAINMPKPDGCASATTTPEGGWGAVWPPAGQPSCAAGLPPQAHAIPTHCGGGSLRITDDGRTVATFAQPSQLTLTISPFGGQVLFPSARMMQWSCVARARARARARVYAQARH
jgi:hypothetical protein